MYNICIILVIKYGKNSDQSIGNRLSKLNLHSMKKKTSRLGYRLSITLGITQLVSTNNTNGIVFWYKYFRNVIRYSNRLNVNFVQLRNYVEHYYVICNFVAIDCNTLLNNKCCYAIRGENLSVRSVIFWFYLYILGANRLLFGYYSAWKHCIDVILPEFFATIRLRYVVKQLSSIL